MRKLLVLSIAITVLPFAAVRAQTAASAPKNAKAKVASHAAKSLSADEYEQLLKKKKNEVLVDVRTPDEYNSGHLKDAQNIDFRSAGFQEEIGKLNKNNPVFLYCMSGGRSSQAAEQLKSMGFKEIYNLDGGILKWKAAGKPIEGDGKDVAHAKGMSVPEFNKQTHAKNYVLVDFNATWCGPCKMMMPILESVAAKHKTNLKLLKIDADQNPDLVREKNISSIHYIELYKDGQLVWQHIGYIAQSELEHQTSL